MSLFAKRIATSLPDSRHLSEIFDERVRLTPAREAYRQFETSSGKWRSYSWSQVNDEVGRWRAALRREGFPAGSRVAILLPNSVAHVCLDQAAQSLGWVPVPLHVVDNPESVAFILGDSGAVVLVVDSLQRWNLLVPLQERFPAVKRVLYLSGSSTGTAVSSAQPVAEWLQGPLDPETDAARAADPESLAAIVYTSGTTGRPKGVMLTHRNVTSNIHAILQATPLSADDVFLSFLPLSHTLERTVGYYLPIAAGAAVAFSRSIHDLMDDFRSVRPTALVSVPRIYERAYAVLRSRIDGSPFLRGAFDVSVRLGYRRFESMQGRARRLTAPSRCLLALLDVLLGRRVRQQFGGRLRVAVTGGAPMPAEVARPLLAMGLPLLQGYGMTESSPVVSSNTLLDNDPTTVGRPLPGIQVRIGEQDELLTRSDSVMSGYWNRAAETGRVIDSDGWLHTGDQAELVDGRIRIKGRIKDIIVTSTGEKVAPADLESAIATDPLFEQVLVIGEQRPYLAAMVVLNPQRWQVRAAELGLDPTNPALLRSATATQWVLSRIAQLVKSFPSYSTPKAVFLSTVAWTVASGLLTPTLKPKRAAIASRYADEITRLYRGH